MSSARANLVTKCDFDAVFLIGFGGPEAPGEIRPFLDRVLRGRPVPPARYEEVVHHYEALGGRSPYNALTRRQAAALKSKLHDQRLDLPVIIGYRNARPYFDEALRNLAEQRARRVLGFILSAFRCDASWERYQAEVAAACTEFGEGASEIIYPSPWHTNPLFIEAVAAGARDALARVSQAESASVELIFTTHSIPLAMAAASSYVTQLNEAAKLVADVVGASGWRLAYQSRSGNPREPWLEPDIRDALIANPRPKVVVPIGFLCDHVEVLYDLDIQAAALARNHGVTMVRAPTVGDHPRFIELLASLATS